MSEFILSILAFIITLGLLITFHEAGHFWVARRCGVKVLRFSIGFGQPFWCYRSPVDGTEYAITALPLGGYVRMLDERDGEVDPDEVHRAFNRQPIPVRMAIVAAGPVANFLLAIVLYAITFLIGVPGMRPVLDAPRPGSVAAFAGFQARDVITAIDGQSTPTLQDVTLALLDRGAAHRTITVQVQDSAGETRNRWLTLPDDALDPSRLLEQLGFVLWNPPLPAVIDRVQSGSAAARAGLQAGDRILAVQGQPLTGGWQQWTTLVRQHPQQSLQIDIERDGQRQSLPITPEAKPVGDKIIGFVGANARVPPEWLSELHVVQQYDPLTALGKAAQKTWNMSLLTLRMLGRMIIGQASLENIGGPITIAQVAGQSASIGLIAFLSFLALVSLSLGVLNLLPIPILDGGHLLYDFIAWLRGSPLSEQAQEIGQRVGFVVLILLMSLALFNDLTRLFN